MTKLSRFLAAGVIFFQLAGTSIFSKDQETEINSELLGFPYKFIEDALLCYVPESKFVSRHITIFLNPDHFNEGNLKELFQLLSFQYKRPEELLISVFTNEEEMRWHLAPHPLVLHGPQINDPMVEKLKDNSSLYASFIRQDKDEAFTYTVDPIRREAKRVILKGRDPYYFDGHGFAFEIIGGQFVKSQGEVECVRRELDVLISRGEFNEHNLEQLFRFLSSRYPQPKDLAIRVYTSLEHFQKVNPNIHLRFKPKLHEANIIENVPTENYLFATFERVGNQSYFEYTIYPFIINRYGGFEMKKVVLN